MQASPLNSAQEQRTLADKATLQLKRDILHGKLEQGAKISEEQLAQDYGASRGPIREAIRRVEGMRLITRIPHAGARVVMLDTAMMQELYVVREALEGMSARLAAQQMSDKDIDSLWQLLEDHEKAIDDTHGKAYFQSEGDMDFHFRIAASSNNQWLMQLLGSELYQLMRLCRRRSAQMGSRPTKALKEHRRIVEAISMRDEQLAELLMRRHISGAWKMINDSINEETE